MPLEYLLGAAAEAMLEAVVLGVCEATGWTVGEAWRRRGAKDMGAAQQQAIFSVVVLVMLADGAFSLAERKALRAHCAQLEDPEAAWSQVELAQTLAADALASGRELGFVDEALQAVPDPDQRRTLVELVAELHRLDHAQTPVKDGIVDSLRRSV